MSDFVRDAADYANASLTAVEHPDDIANVRKGVENSELIAGRWAGLAVGYVAGRQSVRDLVASVDPACRCEPNTGCPWSKLREMLGYDP